MLINYIEFFPKAQTFIARQLREAVDVPVIIHYAVADAPPVLFFGGPVLALFDDSLLWRKIAYDTRARLMDWCWRRGR